MTLETVSKSSKIILFILILSYITYYIYVEVNLEPQTLVINGTICKENEKYFSFEEIDVTKIPDDFLELVEERFSQRRHILENHCQKFYHKGRNETIQVSLLKF